MQPDIDDDILKTSRLKDVTSWHICEECENVSGYQKANKRKHLVIGTVSISCV